MSESDKSDLNVEPAPGGEEAKREMEGSDGADDLRAAIDLLESGKPLVLNDGFLATDSGNMIISQYLITYQAHPAQK